MKSFRRYLTFALVLAMTAACAFAPVCAAESGTGGFSDVDSGAWYAEGAAFVQERGIMEGCGNGVFGPDKTLTRAQLVTMLWRIEGSPVANYAMTFGDVAAGSWYAEAVRWAAAEKVVEGYSDSEFGPNDVMTREQAATVLCRYVKAEVPEGVMGLAGYQDYMDISPWAHQAMLWATHEDVLRGNEGLIMPKKTVTRAEAAVMLQRLLAEGDKTVS